MITYNPAKNLLDVLTGILSPFFSSGFSME